MKKIYLIIIFLLLIILNNNHIKAYENNIEKPIMILKGYDQQDILEYDNYTILNSNVNFKEEGTYQIEYINSITKETFIKPVHVVSKNKQNTYINYQEKEQIENAETIIKTKDSSYIYTQRKHYAFNEENIVDYIIYKQKDNQIIWSKTIFKNVIGKIINISEDNEYIYIISSIYSELTNQDVYIHVLNKFGEVIYNKCFYGTSLDNITGVKIKDNYIYIYGNTLSNDLDFKHKSEREDSYILQIDKNNLIIKNTYFLSEELIDDIIDIEIYDDYIYVLQQYVRKDINRVTYKIIKLTIDNKIINTFIFYKDIYFKPIKMKIFNNDLYILTNNNDLTELYKLNIYDFKINLIQQITKSKGIDLLANNLTLYLYYQDKENKNYINIYNSETKLILQQETKSKITHIIDENTLYSNNHITLFNYFITNFNNESFTIKYNNKILKPSNKSNIYIDQNTYGKYLNFYYYESPIIDFCGYIDNIIPLKTSVLNNETYDNNILISFNGIGYLNDKLIDNNYLINIPGEYELKVKGYNEENIIKFKVENLSTQNQKITKPIEITYEEEKIISEENINIKEYNLEESNEIKNKKTTQTWYIIFPILSTLLFIYTIIKKRG